MDKETVKQIVIDMIKESEIIVETFVVKGNYKTELVTVVGTNLGEGGYTMLKKNRDEIKNVWVEASE
jgi:hypothetical protein